MLVGAANLAWLSTQPVAAADAPLSLNAAAPYYYDVPAVDGLNAKVEGLAGSLARHDLYGSQASVSFPLGRWVGLQIDGAGGTLDERAFGGVAGHLFLRNPAMGLLGVYVSHTFWDRFGGVAATQATGEFELYWGRLTLQGIAGVEFGSSSSHTITTTTVRPAAIGVAGAITTTTSVDSYDVKTRFIDQVNLKYYLTEDWQAYAGHRYLGGEHALALGTELALPLGGGVMSSGFVEARLGTDEFEGIWGGLRFYFGRMDKPLIRRHREDDPIQWDTLFTITNSENPSTSGSITPIPPIPPEPDLDPAPDPDPDPGPPRPPRD